MSTQTVVVSKAREIQGTINHVNISTLKQEATMNSTELTQAQQVRYEAFKSSKPCKHGIKRFSCDLCNRPLRHRVDMDFGRENKQSHASLYDHRDYGEGMMAVCYHQDGTVKKDIFDGKRIRYMTSDGMTQLERQLFEDTQLASGMVVKSYVDNGLPVAHLDIQKISKRVKCDLRMAQRIVDTFKMMDFTREVANKYLDEFKASKTLNDDVVKLEWLAFQLEPVVTFVDNTTEIIRKANEDGDHELGDEIEDESPRSPSYLRFHRFEQEPDEELEPETEEAKARAKRNQMTYRRIIHLLRASNEELKLIAQKMIDSPYPEQKLLWVWYKHIKEVRNPVSDQARLWIKALRSGNADYKKAASELSKNSAKFNPVELKLLWNTWKEFRK